MMRTPKEETMYHSHVRNGLGSRPDVSKVFGPDYQPGEMPKAKEPRRNMPDGATIRKAYS